MHVDTCTDVMTDAYTDGLCKCEESWTDTIRRRKEEEPLADPSTSTPTSRTFSDTVALLGNYVRKTTEGHFWGIMPTRRRPYRRVLCFTPTHWPTHEKGQQSQVFYWRSTGALTDARADTYRKARRRLTDGLRFRLCFEVSGTCNKIASLPPRIRHINTKNQNMIRVAQLQIWIKFERSKRVYLERSKGVFGGDWRSKIQSFFNEIKEIASSFYYNAIKRSFFVTNWEILNLALI